MTNLDQRSGQITVNASSRFSIAELEAATGVSPRTIRFYISEGLLNPAYGRGSSAQYDGDHLLRLRYIQMLKTERLALGDIRERMNQLSSEDIALALDISIEPEAETWRHIRLHQDLVLIRREVAVSNRDPRLEHAVAQIVDYARAVLAELRRDDTDA